MLRGTGGTGARGGGLEVCTMVGTGCWEVMDIVGGLENYDTKRGYIVGIVLSGVDIL